MVMTPLGWPMRTAPLSSVGAPSTSYSGVPGTARATETAQALVSGKGEWLYSLDGEIYGEEIPTAVNAGEYTVYFKATEAAEPQTITVTVAKADAEFIPPVAAVE